MTKVFSGKQSSKILKHEDKEHNTTLPVISLYFSCLFLPLTPQPGWTSLCGVFGYLSAPRVGRDTRRVETNKSPSLV